MAKNSGAKWAGVVITLTCAITALILAHSKSGVYSSDVTRQELKAHGVIKW